MHNRYLPLCPLILGAFFFLTGTGWSATFGPKGSDCPKYKESDLGSGIRGVPRGESDLPPKEERRGAPETARSRARAFAQLENNASSTSQTLVSVSGRIVDAGNGKGISNAVVYVRGSSIKASTRSTGEYTLSKVPARIQTLEVRARGYRVVRTTLKIRGGELLPVIRLPRVNPSDVETADVIEVTDVIEKSPQPVERVLTLPELQRVPGSFNDAVRAVQNLPGVARSPVGILIVRGTEPQDTGYYVDGIRVPNIFHLFGLHTVVNSDMLEQVTFLPGNYGVRYGRTYGGVLDAVMSRKVPQEFKGDVGADLLNTVVHSQIPLGKNGGLELSFRRSYADLILEKGIETYENVTDSPVNLGIREAPQYWDYQVLYNKQINPKNFIHALVFGAGDALRIVGTPPAAIPPSIRGNGEVVSASGFHKALIRWRYQGQKVSSLFTFSTGPDIQQFSFGGFDLDARNLALFAREDLSARFQPLPNLVLRPGFDTLIGFYSFDLYLPFNPTADVYDPLADPEPFSRDLNGMYFFPSPFLEAEYQLTHNIRLLPGLRVDPFVIPGLYATTWADPRITGIWSAGKNTFIKASAGRYGQNPPPFAVDETIGGNPELKAPYSLQYLVGIEQGFTSYLTLEANAYYNDLNRLVIVPQPDGGNPETVTSFTNDGRGRNVGLELLLRHNPNNGFFGWISYTLQRAQRLDGLEADEGCSDPDNAAALTCWYPFDFDQTHILTLLGSYDLPHGWTVGGRFRYSTGRPFTAISGSYYDADTDQYQPLPAYDGLKNNLRIPAFNDLTLRVDKKFKVKKVKVNAYVEVINVYNRSNAEAEDYNFDYSEISYRYGLPIFPNIGFKAEF